MLGKRRPAGSSVLRCAASETERRDPSAAADGSRTEARRASGRRLEGSTRRRDTGGRSGSKAGKRPPAQAARGHQLPQRQPTTETRSSTRTPPEYTLPPAVLICVRVNLLQILLQN